MSWTLHRCRRCRRLIPRTLPFMCWGCWLGQSMQDKVDFYLLEEA